jgi:hypothetical protein
VRKTATPRIINKACASHRGEILDRLPLLFPRTRQNRGRRSISSTPDRR